MILKDTNDANVYTEYAEILDKATSDSNAGALDNGFDLAVTFADSCPAGFMKTYYEKLCANAVEKAFGARPSTLQKGKSLLQKLIEIDEPGPQPVTSYLLTKLNDKKPKVPPICLEVLKDSIVAFGAKPFPIKEIIAALPAVLNGTNGPARDMATELILEISKWIGMAPFHSLLENIRAVQKTDIEKKVADRDAAGPIVLIPTVWLRSQRPAPGSASAAGQLAKTANDMDSRDFLEDIDLIKKLKSTDYATLITDEKWSEQLRALTFIIDILGPTPKIKTGCDVNDIVTVCKGFLKQGHLQLQISSLKIIGLLSNGLRTEFSHCARNSVQLVVQKYKEKRLIPDVTTTLLSMVKYCISFDSFSEDVLEQLGNKKLVPAHARVGILEFIIQSLSSMAEKYSNDILKPLAEMMVSSYDDPDPKVRDTAAMTLIALSQVIKTKGAKLTPDATKYMNNLETINPKLYKKISSTVITNDTNNTDSTTAVSTTTKANASSMNVNKMLNDNTSSTATSNVAANGVKKSLSSKPNTTGGSTLSKKVPSNLSISTKDTTSTTTSTSTTANNDDDNVEELTLSPEDAELALANLNIPGWDSSFQTNITSVKWLDKVDAITLLGTTIAETNTGGKYSSPLIVYLSSKTSGFKISNVNILKAVMQTACQAAKHVGDVKFNRSAGWELIKQFGDKYSDKKTKELVDELLTALCTTLQPSFVVKRMKFIMDKTKAPLAHQFFLEWLRDTIKESGINQFPIQFLAQFCQVEMENKIAQVRTSAIEVLGVMYNQIGPRFLSIATSNDMKPQMVTLIEAEFAKVGYDPVAANAKASTSGVSADGGIPRQDLMTLVDKNILTELNFSDGKNSWQNRKAAIESVISACEKSGHYLDATKNTAEVVKLLKLRVNDTQANLKPLAVTAIGHVIASLDPSSGHKILRLIADGLLSGLADNKKQMRDSTVAALQMLVTLNKSENTIGDPLLIGVLIPAVGEALTATIVGRQELLAWLLPLCSSFKTDHPCSELTVPLVTCLQDKIAAVRGSAEQILAVLMSYSLITKVTLDKATRDLPTAVKRTLTPIVDKLMALYGTATSATPSPSNTSTTTSTAAAAANNNPTSESTKTLKGAASFNNPSKSPTHASHASETAREAAVRRDSLTKANLISPSHATKNSSSSTMANTNGGALESPRKTNSTAVDNLMVNPNLPESPTLLKKSSMNSLPPTPSGTQASNVDQTVEIPANFYLKKSLKTKRLDADLHKLNWPMPPEEPSEHEFTVLKSVWEPFLSSIEFINQLFPVSKFGPLNQDQIAPVMNDLCTQLDGPAEIWLTHTDLLIRYLSCCLSMRETGSGMIKVLQAILLLVLYMKRQNYMLHEIEINILLPHLIDKSGHKSDRHRTLFKQVLNALADVMLPNKLSQFLIQGFTSKNKKSRVVCIEILNTLVETSGITILSKSGIKDIGNQLDAKDSDPAGRSPCLDLCYAMYISLGSDLPKLLKLFGENLSERASSMIEDRIKQKNRTNIKDLTVVPTTSSAMNTARIESARDTKSVPVTASSKSLIDTNINDDETLRTRRTGASPLKLNIKPNGSGSTTGTTSSLRMPSPLRSSSPIGGNNSYRRPASPGPQRIASRSSTPLLSGRSLTPSHSARLDFDTQTTLADKIKSSKKLHSSSDLTRTMSGESNTTASAKDSANTNTSTKVISYTGLPGLFGDIAEKMDIYLMLQSNSPKKSTDSSMNATTSITREMVNVTAEGARDYIKILHAMITGEWTSENTDEDDQMLRSSVDSMVIRLCKCLSFVFKFHQLFPSLLSSSSTEDSNNTNNINNGLAMSTAEKVLQMDVSLAAVILATLFALIKRKELLLVIRSKTLEMVIEICLTAIVDPRLAINSKEDEVINVIKQISKGVNTIVLRIASDLSVDKTLCILIPIMTKASLSQQGVAKSIEEASLHKIMQPLSRLIRRVVYLEGQNQTPFQQPHMNIARILEFVHDFFIQIPNKVTDMTSDDINMITAKTVVSEIAKALGTQHILNLIQTTSIPESSPLLYVIHQCGSAASPNNTSKNLPLSTTTTMKVNSPLNQEAVQHQLVAIIHEITSARDKSVPIAKLHNLRKQNPDLDVSESLQSISSAFRRFVLDTLTKMDRSSGYSNNSNSNGSSNIASTSTTENTIEPDENHNPTLVGSNNINQKSNLGNNILNPNSTISPTATTASAFTLANMNHDLNDNNNDNDKGQEAMRILEGLINKPNQRASFGSRGGPNSSPLRSRSALKDPLQLQSINNNNNNNNNNLENQMNVPSPTTASKKENNNITLNSRTYTGSSPRTAIKENIRRSLSNLSSSLDLDSLRLELNQSLSSTSTKASLQQENVVIINDTTSEEEETY